MMKLKKLLLISMFALSLVSNPSSAQTNVWGICDMQLYSLGDRVAYNRFIGKYFDMASCLGVGGIETKCKGLALADVIIDHVKNSCQSVIDPTKAVETFYDFGGTSKVRWECVPLPCENCELDPVPDPSMDWKDVKAPRGNAEKPTGKNWEWDNRYQTYPSPSPVSPVLFPLPGLGPMGTPLWTVVHPADLFYPFAKEVSRILGQLDGKDWAKIAILITIEVGFAAILVEGIAAIETGGLSALLIPETVAAVGGAIIAIAWLADVSVNKSALTNVSYSSTTIDEKSKGHFFIDNDQGETFEVRDKGSKINLCYRGIDESCFQIDKKSHKKTKLDS